MWLSGANTIGAVARSKIEAEGKRQATRMINEGAKQIADFWAAVLTPPVVPLKAPTKRKKKVKRA